MMKNNRKIIGTIIFVIVAIAGLYMGSPYLTVHGMKAAAIDRNAEKLSSYIEFETLRQGIKDQLNVAFMKYMQKEASDNPFAALGMALGGSMVDRMVDAYVTPAGVTEMMSGEKPSEEAISSSEKEPFANATTSYESLDKFVIIMPSDNGKEGKFILSRRGLEWKLTNIIIPLDDM